MKKDKKNATIYAKEFNGNLYLYARIELDNGKVVNCPIKLVSDNNKFCYAVAVNLVLNDEK